MHSRWAHSRHIYPFLFWFNKRYSQDWSVIILTLRVQMEDNNNEALIFNKPLLSSFVCARVCLRILSECFIVRHRIDVFKRIVFVNFVHSSVPFEARDYLFLPSKAEKRIESIQLRVVKYFISNLLNKYALYGIADLHLKEIRRIERGVSNCLNKHV